jgi:hypothetical protein
VGVTTHFSFPYPELSDAPDGPSQIKALADALDAELETIAPVVAKYYGLADVASHPVTAATLQNVSSSYVIPADEAVAGSAYELCAGGNGTWGSPQQKLTLAMFFNTSYGSGSGGKVDAAAFAASAAFQWQARIILVCADGVSSWTGTMSAVLQQVANAVIPGTAADNSVAVACTPPAIVEAVSSPITVSLQAQWASTTGAPGIEGSWTTFRKVA